MRRKRIERRRKRRRKRKERRGGVRKMVLKATVLKHPFSPSS